LYASPVEWSPRQFLGFVINAFAVAWLVNPDVLERAKRLELPWNRYGIDPYGASRVEIARMLTLLRFLYRTYFRVTVSGLEHVPSRGRAMLVGNHAGGYALDALMVIAAVFFEMEPPRLAQGMAEKFLGRLPLAAMLSQRVGQLTGLPEHASRLLRDERLLLIFPEGARGTAKLFRERHTLLQFGTGFLRLAMETRTPIVPFGFAGGGEAVPTVANLYRLGRLLGVPYLPVTPYVLPVPRPRVRMHLQIGEPMRFEGSGREEDHVIEAHVLQVQERIGSLVGRAAAARGQWRVRHG
jgi:1-acyl-sn-glycerol-3-phosphate acyltransferase